jgi:hypothetical protein
VNSTNTSWIIRLWQHIVDMCFNRAAAGVNRAQDAEVTPDAGALPDTTATASSAAEVTPPTDIRLGRAGFAGDRGTFRLALFLGFLLAVIVVGVAAQLLTQGTVTAEDIYTMVRAFTPFG